MSVNCSNSVLDAARANTAAPQRIQKTGAHRPLRIVHTVSSLKCGGMENFVVRLAAEQQARGHKTAILALEDGPLLENAREQQLDVLVLGEWGRAARSARGLAFMAARRPDVIHSHNVTSLHYGALGKRITGAKLILTDHGVNMMRTPGAWELHATDAIVGVSEKTAADHRNAYGSIRNLHVIHNGVQFSSPKRSGGEVRASLKLPDGIIGIVVARLEPVKDIETLLRAVAILKEKGESMNLLIVGDGSERQRLQDLALALGLSQERIRFLGFRTDVTDLLAASDLFMLSSRDEGLPLALLEAMAQELPVLATDVGGVPELVRAGEHGFLVPAGAPHAMAEMLVSLVGDSALRECMGQAARRHVEREFSFERMSRRYEDLYHSVESR